MPKIMMTGASGRVGTELREYGVLPLRGELNSPELHDTVLREKPDIIVHLASVSNVDFCEKKENQEYVISTNLVGTASLLNTAEEIGAKVVMLSTDHVFNGGKKSEKGFNGGISFMAKKGPYKETDEVNPLNFYGMSKFAAEKLQEAYSDFWVVRTSYLFDRNRLGFDNSTSTFPPTYPDFIYRSFMYLPHFVSNLYMLVNNLEKIPKLIHLSGSMTVSWYGFMRVILGDRAERRSNEIQQQFAPRPYHAGLRSKYKLFPSYSFMDGIEQMMEDRK